MRLRNKQHASFIYPSRSFLILSSFFSSILQLPSYITFIYLFVKIAMQHEYKFVWLLLLFISGYQAQDTTTEETSSPTTTTLPDWYGDPTICTINTPTTPSPAPGKELPKFTNQAEFRLELVIKRHRLTSATTSELILLHYIYDYDNNKLTLVENRNNDVDVQFYEYDRLKRSTYHRGEETCTATDIPTDNDIGMFRLEFLKILYIYILIIRW